MVGWYPRDNCQIPSLCVCITRFSFPGLPQKENALSSISANLESVVQFCVIVLSFIFTYMLLQHVKRRLRGIIAKLLGFGARPTRVQILALTFTSSGL